MCGEPTVTRLEGPYDIREGEKPQLNYEIDRADLGALNRAGDNVSTARGNPPRAVDVRTYGDRHLC